MTGKRSNQSADTKYAAVLIREGVALIECGRLQAGLNRIKQAEKLLPADPAKTLDRRCLRGVQDA